MITQNEDYKVKCVTVKCIQKKHIVCCGQKDYIEQPRRFWLSRLLDIILFFFALFYVHLSKSSVFHADKKNLVQKECSNFLKLFSFSGFPDISLSQILYLFNLSFQTLQWLVFHRRLYHLPESPNIFPDYIRYNRQDPIQALPFTSCMPWTS